MTVKLERRNKPALASDFFLRQTGCSARFKPPSTSASSQSMGNHLLPVTRSQRFPYKDMVPFPAANIAGSRCRFSGVVTITAVNISQIFVHVKSNSMNYVLLPVLSDDSHHLVELCFHVFNHLELSATPVQVMVFPVYSEVNVTV